MNLVKSGALFGGLAILAGCGLSLNGVGQRLSLDRGDAPQSIGLVGGAVVAVGPEGFCVDPTLSRPADGFAVLTTCAVLTGSNAQAWGTGLLTIQAGPPGSAIVTGTEEVVIETLRGAQGRALLSGRGTADDIQIDRLSSNNGVVVVQFRDQGAPVVAGTDDTEWRAFLDIAGRLTTVSLRGYTSTPLSADQGAQLISDAVGRLAARNPGTQTAALP